MDFYNWAARWQIPAAAIQELKQVFNLQPSTVAPVLSEAAVSNLIKAEASAKGMRLWRNNVGAGTLDNGSFIRFGLANESSQINKVIKSADLIGIKPVVIQPYHVGGVIGQFVSREIKRPGWRYAGTEREQAQLKWAELIAYLGGDACFATGEGTL
jgi:UDP-N-acetylenolpyruvoylglucosamine reductase